MKEKKFNNNIKPKVLKLQMGLEDSLLIFHSERFYLFFLVIHLSLPKIDFTLSSGSLSTQNIL